MPLATIVTATADPVTVEEAKSFARYPHSDQDALIAELVTAATEHVQQATGRQFVPATFALTLRCFPSDGVIRLPRSPLIEVSYVKYRDRDGVEHTLVEDTDFLIDAAAVPPTVEPVKSWPTTGDYPNAVTIAFTAGYAGSEESPPDHAANVPARAKAAVKTLTAHFFEQREPTVFGTISSVPNHVDRLINGLKVWRVA